MLSSDKNKFTQAARHKLVDAGLTVTALASQIGRPRETVSRAIHTSKFPKVRSLIAKELKISLP